MVDRFLYPFSKQIDFEVAVSKALNVFITSSDRLEYIGCQQCG